MTATLDDQLGFAAARIARERGVNPAADWKARQFVLSRTAIGLG